MKIIHLSDLHLGKRFNNFSMIEDQKYILDEIIKVVDREAPDAVIIAGDVYDKSIPPAEAVKLFDDFLYSLASRRLKVFVISGNHDSPDRIAFGRRLMDASGVYMAPVYNGCVKPVTLEDEYGPVHFYMLPFIKPANVKPYHEEVSTYTDAVRAAISDMDIDQSVRNVLITHQFVTGAARCDSETVSVGGSDNVDASVFEPFDYVALGHIHGPQNIGSERIRYSGTPLKYSFSEMNHKKSVTIAEFAEKGTLSVRMEELKPLHDMREIRGKYDDITLKSSYEGTATDDYIRVILTDETDVVNAMNRLRTIYPNIMKLDYDNTRTRSSESVGPAEEIERKSEIELLSDMFRGRTGKELSEEQKEYSIALFEKLKEKEV